MLLTTGHRGAMGYEPETTRQSLKKTLALQVDIVELDVHVCQSGEVVVTHDDTRGRTANGWGPIGKAPLSQLKTLDAVQGETISTFKKHSVSLRAKG